MSDPQEDATYDVEPEEAPAQVEAPAAVPAEAESSDLLSGMDMDEVVSALLQGKFSTDAAEQRRRLEAAGYDPEAVKEAVQRRLAQRYE